MAYIPHPSTTASCVIPGWKAVRGPESRTGRSDGRRQLSARGALGRLAGGHLFVHHDNAVISASARPTSYQVQESYGPAVRPYGQAGRSQAHAWMPASLPPHSLTEPPG